MKVFINRNDKVLIHKIVLHNMLSVTMPRKFNRKNVELLITYLKALAKMAPNCF